MNEEIIKLLTAYEDHGLFGEKNKGTDEPSKNLRNNADGFLKRKQFFDCKILRGFGGDKMQNDGSFKLVFNCFGKSVFSVDRDKTIELTEGDLLFINAKAKCEEEFLKENSLGVVFNIKPEFFTETAADICGGDAVYDYVLSEVLRGGRECILFKTLPEPSITNLVENLIRSALAEKEDLNARNLTMALLFLELSKRSEKIIDNLGNSEDDIILKTVRYIENSFKDAKLGVLAKELGISPVSLSKTIKRRLKLTFKNLLLAKRLFEAEQLIRNTILPITEIIFYVGYENTNFFYGMFSAKFSVSPKEYRRRFQDGSKA